MSKGKYDAPTKNLHEKVNLLEVKQRISLNVRKMFNQLERYQVSEYLSQKLRNNKK